MDLEDDDLSHGAVGIIEDVIHGAGERKNILAVKRGDEGAVQFIDEDAAGFISFLFLGSQLVSQGLLGIGEIGLENFHALQGERSLLWINWMNILRRFLKIFNIFKSS